MRPLYGVVKPKIKSRYDLFRHSLKNRLYREYTGASTEMQASMQKFGSEDGRDWGLRVPGSQTMKTIHLPVSRTHDNDHSESNSISLSDNRTNRQVAEDWV